MTGPQVPVTPDDAEFQAWKAQQAGQTQSAPQGPLTHDDDEFQAWKAARGLYDRTKDLISSQIPHSLSDAASEAKSFVVAPFKSAMTSARASAEQDAENAIAASGGPIGSVPRAVSQKEGGAAGLQTLANLAFPSIVGGISDLAGETAPWLARTAAKGAGLISAGAGAGAAYNPDDPAAGAAAGAFLAPLTHAAGHYAGAGIGAMRNVGNGLLDAAGRPAASQPVRVMGQQVGTVASLADRAAELNRRILANSPSTNGLPADASKPVTPMDVAGTAGVRAARGLKTSSPAAEAVLQDALRGRAEGAVDRVIQHGLETTGLSSRENGLHVVDDMIAQRAQHGNENYQPLFRRYTAPLDDPAFAKIASTPAGRIAVRDAVTLAANRGEKIASMETPGAPDPSTLPPDKQAMYAKLLAMNGGQIDPTMSAMARLGESVPSGDAGPAKITPTLQQAHWVKLAFDDMLASPPRSGTGGLGPTNAASISQLRSQWLSAMDKASPEYADARQTYADESTLIRAAEQGRALFGTRPDVAAKAVAAMPSDAQDIFRRTGFDALAERVENGPADVERGVSKPRDQQRMKLLFPDDDSFNQFKQGLAQEAQLHANEQGALGGSVTADKLADMANMAGITLPDVARAAASGRWHQLAGRAIANATKKVMAPGADAVSAERARQLVAGANGDTGARSAALSQLGMTPGPQYVPPPVNESFQSALARAFGGQYAQRLPMFTLPGSSSRANGDPQP